MAIGLTDMAMVIMASLACAALLLRILATNGSLLRACAFPTTQVNAGPVFLFRDRALVDATPDAVNMLTALQLSTSEYDAVLHLLGAHFPDLQQKLEDDSASRHTIPHQNGGPLFVTITREGKNTRLAIKTKEDEKTGAAASMIENDVLLSELGMLREVTQHTPQLIWQEDDNGKLIWANHAYLAFADKLADPSEQAGHTSWPRTTIFPDLHECLANAAATPRRMSVVMPHSKAECWFDVTSAKREGGFLHFATDANTAVRADQERRNFVQTLGKTFAHLSIGLAIFDKRRELAMFNPALLDLTHLSATFLSSRPTIDTVLDRLREARVLPEPKNYASWREQFTAVEARAKDGTYCEIWNLPDGQAYRVTGRPHPDGAFAFLFEDITAEVSLTRRFRSDIETGQAVLDTLPEAIAVFSSTGTMVMSNASSAELWSMDQPFGLHHRDLRSELQTWQNRCTPTRMWADLTKFAQPLSDRKSWTDTAILDDGRTLTCRADPISGGMTMVRFTFAASVPPVIQKLTMADPAIRRTHR